MKISPLSMDLRAGKAPGSHAIELEAVSSAFSRMGSTAEALPSPDGLRPVRTAWRQPEDVAKVGVSHGRSQTFRAVYGREAGLLFDSQLLPVKAG